MLRFLPVAALCLVPVFPTLAPAQPGRAEPPAAGEAGASHSAVQIIRDRLLSPAAPATSPSPELIDRLSSPAAKTAPPAERQAAEWLERNRAGVVGARMADLPQTVLPNGRITRREPDANAGGRSTLYLHLFDHHASGKAIAYGLSGENVRRAYWLGEPGKDLKVEATGRDTIVEVTPKNGKAPDPVATVIALEIDGGPKLNSLVIAPRADGSVLLHSKEAVVVGRNLRYEPEPHKNTVGYWTNPDDYATWHFKLDKPGSFDVEMLQGCGKNSGGSEVEVTVDGGQPLPMTVQDTGHFQNFIPRVIGRVKLDAGEHVLAVKVKQKKGVAVMDLRQVTLKPAE